MSLCRKPLQDRFPQCCQTKANSSQFQGSGGQIGRILAAPMSETGGAVGLEMLKTIWGAVLRHEGFTPVPTLAARSQPCHGLFSDFRGEHWAEPVPPKSHPFMAYSIPRL